MRDFIHPLSSALIALILFCLVAILCRGVRWDENYEFAQIILGQISPPEGHPLVQYVRNAFSLQTYSTALLLFITGSPFLTCGFRNLLFILATVLPVFLITARLASSEGGKANGPSMGAAAIATLLVLFGVHLEFDSSYPQFVWPDLFSNGHIGAGYALMAVYLFISRYLAAGSLLLGLMPCIHIGQMAPVALFAAYQYYQKIRTSGFRSLARPLAFFSAGLGFCFAYWLLRRPFLIGPPNSGNYFVSRNPWPIWRSFVANHDIHRAIPVGNVWLLLVGALILLGMTAYLLRKEPRAEVWRDLFIYAVGIAVIVVPIAAVHAVLRDKTPYLLLQWMPYRLLNHLPVLLVSAVCAILGKDHRGRFLMTAVLLYCVLSPLTSFLIPQEIYTRYLIPSAGLLFVLYGAAMTAILSHKEVSGARLLPLSGLVLLPFHRFGACCWILGGYAARMAGSFSWLTLAMWFTIFAAAGDMLYQQLEHRQTLPVPTYARDIQAFCSVAAPRAVLLASPDQLLLQAQTGHAVLSDMALPFMITYLPSIGPAIERMYNEVYGISFLPNPASPLSGDMHNWQTWWPSLSASQWRRLAEDYSFEYVIAPATMSLSIPRVLMSGDMALYQPR